MNLFVDDILPVDWDHKIYMESVVGRLDFMELSKPLPCGDGFISPGYRSDGATVGPARRLFFFGFPKWKHPIATFRHDARCEIAEEYKRKGDMRTYHRLRLFADQRFKIDVGVGGTWWEQQKGYAGVRLGAYT